MIALILAAEEGATNGHWIPADIKEFWWGLLAFLIVFGLMAWKGLPVAKAGLDKAQAKALADANAAENATAEARARVQAATAELGDSNAEAERLIAEARTSANQLAVDSATRTQELVNDMWAKAQTDVVAMKTQAQVDVQSEVAQQAFGAAEMVVKNQLDDAGQASLIEDYIARLGASQ